MAQIKISGLQKSTPNADIEIPATNPNDLATPTGKTFKYYLTDIMKFNLSAQGFTTYTSCRVGTTLDLGAVYANGVAGVGATLTNAGAQAPIAIDGVTLSLGDRVLVKNQTNNVENGIYTVTTIGTLATNWVLTRATDFDQPADIVYLGVVVINQGTVNGGTIYQEQSEGPFTIGVSPISFTILFANYVTPLDLQTNAFSFAVDTGVADAYVANLTPAVAALTAGLTLFVKITNANTGASTLTVNGLTAPIVTTHNVALTAGLLIANQAAVFVYSTTLNAFILINPAIIPVISGGTGNNSVGANGTLAQSDGSKYTFTTATYPSTTQKWHLLYSSNNNVVGEITHQKNAVLVCDNNREPNWSSPLTDGQIIIGKTNDIPVAANLTAGTNISITNAANSITINSTGGTVSSGLINQLAWYAANGTTVSGLTAANSATLATNSTGAPAWTAPMTNGQVLIGTTGGTPTPATLTAGSNITITNAAGSITIASTGGGGSGVTWAEVTGTSQAMAVNYGYVANNAGLVTLTLPGTAALGSLFYVQGKGAGGWKIAQNAGQQINFGSVATTVGVGGYLASSAQYDSICLVCITANTTFAVLGGPQGAITYV